MSFGFLELLTAYLGSGFYCGARSFLCVIVMLPEIFIHLSCAALTWYFCCRIGFSCKGKKTTKCYILALWVESLIYFGVHCPIEGYLYMAFLGLLLGKGCVEKTSFYYSVSPGCADVVSISSKSSIWVIELLTIFTGWPSSRTNHVNRDTLGCFFSIGLLA